MKQDDTSEEVKGGWAKGGAGADSVLLSYVDVIPSDGQVKLLPEHQCSGHLTHKPALSKVVCSQSPLLQSGKSHEK